MGTLNAFYVRVAANAAVITVGIRTKFPNAQVEADTQFCGVTMTNDLSEAPERDLMELSSRLKTDVIWLSFQSTVDAFPVSPLAGGRASALFGLRLLCRGAYLGACRGHGRAVGARGIL